MIVCLDKGQFPSVDGRIALCDLNNCYPQRAERNTSQLRDHSCIFSPNWVWGILTAFREQYSEFEKFARAHGNVRS